MKLTFASLLSVVLTTGMAFPQEHPAGKPGREALLSAASEIIEKAGYCALATVDASGQPRVRTMDPFPLGEDFVVWFGTSRKTRKVREIQSSSKVTVYYADPGGGGYVSIYGQARLVDDEDKKSQLWKESWEEFYPDKKADYLLISVTPKTLEVVNYSRGIVGDQATWLPNSIRF